MRNAREAVNAWCKRWADFLYDDGDDLSACGYKDLVAMVIAARREAFEAGYREAWRDPNFDSLGLDAHLKVALERAGLTP